MLGLSSMITLFLLMILALSWIAHVSGKLPIEEQIINGKTVSKGTYPFIVSIQRYGSHFCGGSILNYDTILTAAHCLYGHSPTGMTVYIGHVDISKKNTKYIFKAKKLIVHPLYKDSDIKAGNDVALIKLHSKINFKKLGVTVGRICLPRSSDRPNTKVDCFVMGWGRDERNQRQTLLKEASFKIQPKSKCDHSFSGYNAKKVYCALGSTGYGRSCRGDSGGPIICKPLKGDKPWVQFGVVSFGGPDCKSQASFFTKIEEYYSWITKTAK